MSNHVIISGTGRAGTTFLVKLLTKLGYDTGFNEDELKIFGGSNAGLEINLLKNISPPYIVKDPNFFEYANSVFQNSKFFIDHIIIPIRDIKRATESRCIVESELSNKGFAEGHVPGGLIGTSNPDEQEGILLRYFYDLLFKTSKTNIPIILIHYPRMLVDSHYLFAKLNHVFKNLDFNLFNHVFRATVDLSIVEKYKKEEFEIHFNYLFDECKDDFCHNVSAQLYYDTHNGFSEKNSVIEEYILSENEHAFKFDKPLKIKRVRYDPANDQCIIRLKEVVLIKANGTKLILQNVESNSIYKRGDTYFFLTKDPQFTLPVNDEFVQIRFYIEFAEIGSKVPKLIIENLLDDVDTLMIEREKTLKDYFLNIIRKASHNFRFKVLP